MASHIDNSLIMSREDVKQSILSTISKYAEKAVQRANYDKTILATVQYCTDSSIGQYKIKYQNGYYTAYAQDTSRTYLSKAAVYVLVPRNDMNNRLFITGSATNDSTQKVYTRNLEGDQQFSIDGSNYITKINSNIDMSSYWGAGTSYSVVLWSAESDNNLIEFNSNINEFLQDAEYIRFGASFKTALTESRKASGNYGLILTLSYKDSDGNIYPKAFVLDTFSMNGSPFNFSTYMPQYDYWEVNQAEFYRVERIEEFVENFPAGTEPSADFRDIFIKDISLYRANKLYDSYQDKYKVELISEDNWTFSGGSSVKSAVTATANLKVDGNIVQDSFNQKLQYFWAKEDGAVNYVNHPKYNAYFGKGWYCLNDGMKISYNNESIQDLKEGNYTITQENTSVSGEAIEWNPNVQTISISRNLCKGQKTRIKCIVVYENTPISSDIKEIVNESGYYVRLEEVNDRTEFFNGIGSFSLVAGVFQDTGADAPNVSKTLDSSIGYHWTEIDSLGNEKVIPNSCVIDSLVSNEEWADWAKRTDDHPARDTEAVPDAEVEALLEGKPELELCRQRYEYYNSQSQHYKDSEDAEDIELYNICNRRARSILQKKLTSFYTSYTSDYSNNSGYYIFGPSSIVGGYADAAIQNYRSATIESSQPIFYGETGYVSIYNTLYNIPASKIVNNITYRVTAYLTETIDNVTTTQEIGTQSIVLINNPGNLTDYDLKIVNGKQTFMYSNGGIAPTTAAGSEHPIIIRPLSFKLFNKEGYLIYDSEDPDNEEFRTNITELHPVWRFYDTATSLLKTDYKGTDNTSVIIQDGIAMIEVENEGHFIYTIADEYDVNKKEASNIELEVQYAGMTITASTDFTFIKQGDLGTNGTNRILEIEDPIYNQYKSLVLTDDAYSVMTKVDTNSKNYYYPSQRHLNNTYLYATMCYDENKQPLEFVSTSRYVNLKFAQSRVSTEDTTQIENGNGLGGTSSATFMGYWNENGSYTPISNTSQWDTEVNSGYYKGTYYYSVPSFELQGDKVGNQVIANISYLDSDLGITYKPTEINDYPHEGGEYTRIANNLIKVKANTSSAIATEDTDIRTNWGYYPIPYYYFNWTGAEQMPDYVDPARHIVIVGGFDQVVYDSAGANPQYNKQEPFKVYLFDENGLDMTSEFLNGILTGRSFIRWTCSFGFTGTTSLPVLENIKSFPNGFNTNEQLYGQYCRYNNKIYKCIHSHTRGQIVEIKYGKNQKKTYAPNSFIPSYWEEQSEAVLNAQEYKVTPATTYDSIAKTALFNSWVSVNIHFRRANGRVYDGEVLLPINVICNKYGSDLINGWDGKKTEAGDSYIISSQVAAGVKNDNNTFTGVTIGETFYPDSAERHNEIGLFGYGHTDGDATNPNSWARTVFMDANTGRTILGPSGASQIILNPAIGSWSKLSGWYFSTKFLYKPIGENSGETYKDFTSYSQGAAIAPPANPVGSIGMYSPWDTTATKDDVFLWASSSEVDLDDELDSQGNPVKGKATDYTNFNSNSSKPNNFYVTYGGHLHAASADIAGKIVAKSGKIGVNTDNNYIEIGVEKNNKKYLLYNKNFWVGQVDQNDDSDNAFGAMLKGRIMANSGMFGNISQNSQGQYPDGNSSGTLFIEYKWYPWVLPANNEPWDANHFYLNTAAGRTQQYALYNKNFYIDNAGNVFFNGKMFTESGRIGNWVISRDYLSSVDGNVLLSPSYLKLGSFLAQSSGALSGTSWSISADGYASFTNPQNQFTGSKFVIAGGAGGGTIMTLDDDGIWLKAGERIKLGGDESTGATGYMAAGNDGLLINTGDLSISDDVLVGGKLYFHNSTGGYATMWLNKEGIYINGRDGEYRVYTNGNAILNRIDANSIYIDGTSITEYIRQKVKELFDNSLPTTFVTSISGSTDSFMRHTTSSHDYWGSGLTYIQGNTENRKTPQYNPENE